jgi:hypothetical protein
MANLRQRATGLPFIVFISQRDAASHGARVKVSPAPKVRLDQMSSYSIRPFQHKDGPVLSRQEEQLLEKWVNANARVLEEYWNGDIEYTEDAIASLMPV